MATVHEIVVREIPDAPTTSPALVAEHVLPIIGYRDREFMLTLVLNTKNFVIHTEIVSIGTLAASICHPRELFKPAIVRGGAAIILAHNHPSGIVDPSNDDREFTRRAIHAGTILGIRVLDHVVVGPKGNWYSIQGEEGGSLMPDEEAKAQCVAS